MLKIELKRAFCNKMFFIAVLLGVCIALLQVYQDAFPYAAGIELYPDQYPPSVYNTCMGYSISVWNTVFYMVFPLLCALPYADSFLSDKKSGYLENIYTRSCKCRYLTAKFTAVFLSGGTAVVLPLLLNLFLTALCVPAVIPDASTGFFPIFGDAAGASIYYTYPIAYVLLYDLLLFAVSGIFACTALAFSFFIRYRYVILLTPFLLFMAISCLFGMVSSNGVLDISQWILPSQQSSPLVLPVAFAELLVLLALTGAVYYYRGLHDDTI